MRIEIGELICGIRPVTLKKLFGRETFSTPRAMLALGLGEPDIGETLGSLARDGWIAYLGARDGVDRWETTALGDRLCATRLIKRFPVAEGRRILADVLERARSINAEALASHRITQIILFGSVLTAGDDEDAGDIDLVIDVDERSLEPEPLKALIEAEKARMPRHLGFFERMRRPRDDILRQIKKVSRRISLHVSHDLSALKAPHRIVYAYDLEDEREVEADPTIRVLSGKRAPEPEPEAGLAPPERSARPWPVAPNEIARIDMVDDSTLLRAQHLWTTGESIATIAARCRLSEAATQAYLASRRDVGASPGVSFDLSLERMMSTALPRDRAYLVEVSLHCSRGRDLMLKCWALDAESGERIARAAYFRSSERNFDGRCDLLPGLELGLVAARSWWSRVGKRFAPFDVSIELLVEPDDVAPKSVGSSLPNIATLAPLMTEVLGKHLPPAGGYDAWDHRIDALFGDPRSSVIRWNGNPHNSRSRRWMVSRNAEPALWSEVVAIAGRESELLAGAGSVCLTVAGDHLDWVRASVRDERFDD